MSDDKKEARRLQNIKNLKGSKGGRPKGSLNKIPGSLQQDMIKCYERLGGLDGLVRWAKRTPSNRERFYGWCIGLLPKQIDIQSHVTHGLDKLSNDELRAIAEGRPMPSNPYEITTSAKQYSPSLPPHNDTTL